MSEISGLWFRFSPKPTAAEVVLDYLLELGGDETTESEIRAVLGLPRASSTAALRHLSDQGVVCSRRVGRTNVYWTESSDPLVRQLKIAKAVHTASVALKPLERMIDLAVLFGSESRGESHAGSDLDLFVVTRDPQYVRDTLAAVPRFQPVVVTPAEHMRTFSEEPAFANQIARGIALIGG